MTNSMEKVIKQILQIDKNMVRATQEMDQAFRERQKEVFSEIENIEVNILQEAKRKAEQEKERELKKATEEVEEIINRGQNEATALYEKFSRNKERIISEIFKEII